MPEREPSLLDTLVEFFRDNDWPIERLDGGDGLRTAFGGESGQWSVFAYVRDKHEQICIYSVCPINVPDAQRAPVGEFLHRANYGMAVGNFELDFDDGEVRFKTSIDVEGASFGVALARQLVIANVFVMDRYLPGIMAVAFGDAEPAAAFAEIEKR